MKSCGIAKFSHALDHRTFVDRSSHCHASAAPKLRETFIAQDAQGG
jgi:hypothetical protein